MRKAISYWAMRVLISGSPNDSRGQLVELADAVEHARGAVAASMPGGFDRYSTGSSPRAEPHALMLRLGRKPLPHRREKIGWSVLLPLPCEIITTNAGRFSFSLPRP